MNQLTQLWTKLSWAQRIWIAAAIAAAIGGIAALKNWNDERDFKPLFSGLAPEDAGAVTAKLRETGVQYRLAAEGSEILVPSAHVAEARLQLASSGLPKTGRIGFELFDKANFGASDFTEQVNYHRAIEGELERSVMSIGEVEQARVHITMAKDSLYTEQRQPAKASILVKLRHAAALSPQNVAAICQLTASAVPGLQVDQVSLVDTNGNLLNRPRFTANGDADQDSQASIEYRKTVEHDLQTKIAQTLEPLLGAQHFRAGVSADVDLTSGEQSEESYDPQKSAIASSQTTQDGPALASASGVPGTASNVPNATAKASSGASATNYARHTENVNYQTSRVVRHTKLPQGAIKRLSVSVLVDHALRWQGQNKIIEPPPPEKLKVIRDLVGAATGLDMNRGDQLVVDAFPFEATLMAEPETFDSAPTAIGPQMPPWLQKLVGNKNPAVLAGIGGGVLVALLALPVVILLRSGKGKKIAAAEVTRAIEAAKPNEPAAAPSLEQSAHAQLVAQAAEQAQKNAAALAQLKLPTGTANKAEVLTKHIAGEAKKEPAQVAQVVRSWLHGNG
ncbi:MAG: flagellar M-ring protein FliF [Bryobacterales bacterium]|nr:flagellar M-ring protein FliF [Bryobacterales bacterium]MBV9401964.1 flagellar M-ring protein FliF [Bryobacterales bacterium]